MKVKSHLITLCRKALYQSLSVDMMVRFVRIIDPKYDIHRRTGISENIPIPNQLAAERIIADVLTAGTFLSFVEVLVKVDGQGYMGREYPINGLHEILKELTAEGYVYDRASGLFLENSLERVTSNWGRLIEGEEKQMAVLRLDIVGNSILVKKNEKSAVTKAYNELRSIVNRAVLSRQGRVWAWEGDGAVAAFLFDQKERGAILAGMEILHELYWFNRMSNPLSAPIKVRIAAHSGPIRYAENPMELLKNETLKEAVQIESNLTPPDTLSASFNLFLPIDRVIQDCFSLERKVGANKVRQYSIKVEQA
jgi:hypothetical protein